MNDCGNSMLHVCPRACAVYLIVPVFCASLAFATAITAQQTTDENVTEAVSDDATDFDVAVHLESFDVVWETIKKAHWDPEQVGESWDAAREELRPKVAEANSIEEVRDAMNQLLERLGQSHFGIIPSESYKIIQEREESGGEGFSGLTIRMIEDQLVVTAVRDDSPAAAAGIQVGWVVERIGDKSAEDIFDRGVKAGEHSPARVETIVALTCDGLTTGAIGDDVEIQFASLPDEESNRTLKLAKGPGKRATLGHLPAFSVEYRSRQLTGDVGYLAFNAFLDPVRLSEEFQKTLDANRNANGIVIDLRGNRGGMVLLVCGMCGWFVEKTDERLSLGSMRPKGNPLNLVLNPRRPRYDKPVAVLIDECSISAAEIMSGGMKDLGLARVFGSQTAGLVLPSVVTKLPNGDGFQYALADYTSASGKTLEGVGVIPDESISLTKEMLEQDADPVLEAARRWIVEQAKQFK